MKRVLIGGLVREPFNEEKATRLISFSGTLMSFKMKRIL
jgi:hypothetical protein